MASPFGTFLSEATRLGGTKTMLTSSECMSICEAFLDSTRLSRAPREMIKEFLGYMIEEYPEYEKAIMTYYEREFEEIWEL